MTVTDATPYRVALKCARLRDVKESGLSLAQYELCASYGELTAKQWKLWLYGGIRSAGFQLGEYDFHDHDEDEDGFDDA